MFHFIKNEYKLGKMRENASDLSLKFCSLLICLATLIKSEYRKRRVFTDYFV